MTFKVDDSLAVTKYSLFASFKIQNKALHQATLFEKYILSLASSIQKIKEEPITPLLGQNGSKVTDL